MAPEQAAADPTIDHRADIYALGCVAYEMLTGKPPFSGRPARKLLAAQVAERPVPVSRLRPDVSPALEAIVMRCLEKNPDHRWQNADDLTDELNTLMSLTFPSGQAVVQRRLTPWRKIGVYLAAAAVAAAALRLMRDLFALPDWVVTGATLLIALGFLTVLLASRRP